MKKSKWLAALLVSVLMLTGCGKTTSSEDAGKALDEANKKMEELSNYAMKMEMTMGMKAEGMTMEIPVVMNAKVDAKNKIMQMDGSVKVMGEEETMESYTQEVDGKTIEYSKGISYLDGEEVDVWYKETEEASVGYDEFISIAENASKVEQKKSNDKNTNYYQVTIAKEKMQEIMNSSSDLTMGEEEYEIASDVVVDIYVDKTSGYITKISMDLAKVISLDTEAQIEISEFTFTISLSEFDKVGNVTIPEDVIANAIDQDAWDYDDEFEDPEM